MEVVPRFEYEVVIPPEGGCVSLQSSVYQSLNKCSQYTDNHLTECYIDSSAVNEEDLRSTQKVFGGSEKANQCLVNEDVVFSGFPPAYRAHLQSFDQMRGCSTSFHYHCLPIQLKFLHSMQNYTILRQIGLGQFSSVFRAVCNQPYGLNVALKVIKVVLLAVSYMYKNCTFRVRSAPTQRHCEVKLDGLSAYSSLSNFEVQGSVGQGQFSTVWRAFHFPSGQTVAMKKIKVNKNLIDVVESCCLVATALNVIYAHKLAWRKYSAELLKDKFLTLIINKLDTIFEMVDAKARKDCVQEIDLLKVSKCMCVCVCE
ncbi:unnamed protein product [Trichobilharzia regenti]|nr:unnamed protein product [Trichobilharzia regenti]